MGRITDYLKGASGYSSLDNRYVMVLDYWEDTVDIANNTSRVHMKGWVYAENTAYSYHGYNTYGTVSTDGRSTTGDNYTGYVGGSDNNVVLVEDYFTVTHGTDGSKTVTVSFTFETAYPKLANKTISTSFTLTTIPRTSNQTVAQAAPDSGDASTTMRKITITSNRASSSFTHYCDVYYGGVLRERVPSSGTYGASQVWKPTYDTYAPLVKGNSITVSLIQHTYNGSTYIGSKSIDVAIPIPRQSGKTVPTMSSIALDEANTNIPSNWFGDTLTFIQNLSRIKATINGASEPKDANITGYNIKIDNVTYTSNAVTSQVLTTDGSQNVTYKVTSSRGYDSETSTEPINVISYVQPAVSDTCSVDRCTSAGVLDDMGEYIKLSFRGEIQPITFSGSNLNAKAFYVAIKEDTSSTYSDYYLVSDSAYTLNSTGVLVDANDDPVHIDTDKAYDIMLLAEDTFYNRTNGNQIYKELHLGVSGDLLNFAANGLSMAVGQLSTATGNQKKLEVSMSQIYLNGLLYFNDKLFVPHEGNLPIGTIIEFPTTDSSKLPEGWMFCDGSAISRTTYSELFAIIGTSYGTGDGSTTFNLPNKAGRSTIGCGSSFKANTNDTLGALNNNNYSFEIGSYYGAFRHQLTEGQMPSHVHDKGTFRITGQLHYVMFDDGYSPYGEGALRFGTSPRTRTWSGSNGGPAMAPAVLDTNYGGWSGNTGSKGSGEYHTNQSPIVVSNYIIKVKNVTQISEPSKVVDSLEGSSAIDAPSVRAVKEALENLPSGGGGGVDAAPVGTLSPFVGDTAPSGYLFCQGQLVDKALYPELYAICGNTFGTATSTQFYLPDLRGRVIAGYKSGDAEFGTLGGLIGSKYLQQHSHSQSLSDNGSRTGVASYSWATTNTGRWYNGTDLAGGVNGVQTGNAGNIQPTIVLNWMVKAKPTVLLEKLPLGTILEYPFTTNVPDGWHLCDGSAISRTTYAELFALIGTTFGTGDGSTTFNLPNKKGRVSVGIDTSDTDFNTIGKTGGSKALQSHTHDEYVNNASGNKYPYTLSNGGGSSSVAGNFFQNNSIFGGYTGPQVQTGSAGTGNSGNLQPYIVTNYIIKISQVTTLIGEVVNDMTSDSTTNAPSIHAVNQAVGQAITTASKRHVGYIFATTNAEFTHSSTWQYVKTPLEGGYVLGDYFEIDTTNKRLVLKKACTALKLSCSYNWYNSYLRGDHSVAVYKNGSALHNMGYKSSESNVYYDQISCTVLSLGTFNVGDYFELWCMTAGSGTEKIFANSTNLTIEVLE